MPTLRSARGELYSSGGAGSSTPGNGGGEQPGGGDGAAEGLYDLGYLTEGVASYIASLRERVSRTQADLLTVPAQELRSALQVRLEALIFPPLMFLRFKRSTVRCGEAQ